MKYIINDKKYKFKTIFDTDNGLYVRSGIIDENGVDTNVDPFMASFPHLIDVGIMGHCIHGKTGLCLKAGVECYQNGLEITKENMKFDNYKEIVDQCVGRTHQFALGGRGDPDQHEDFEKILKYTRENNIVPNFTTSGFKMTDNLAKICKKYCGAVAVSWYRSEYTIKAIDLLVKNNVKTNIHYVVGKNTIDELLERLVNNDFPTGINAVIILLHKPAGLGSKDNMLSPSDPKVKKLFLEIEKPHSFKIGMDSCNVPGAINLCENITYETLDTCEGARYSCYISSDMIIVPCSFDVDNKYQVDLNKYSIGEAWESKEFEDFRNIMRNSCNGCSNKLLCLGGCPIMPEIVFCNRKERNK
ncbi:MAG: radical SAM protein [bacterium]